jgi:hypothetical protein
MASHLSTILHDIVNAIAIADGMTRVVYKAAESGNPMKVEDQKIRLEKALNAIDRIKQGVDTLRKEVKKLPQTTSEGS